MFFEQVKQSASSANVIVDYTTISNNPWVQEPPAENSKYKGKARAGYLDMGAFLSDLRMYSSDGHSILRRGGGGGGGGALPSAAMFVALSLAVFLHCVMFA